METSLKRLPPGMQFTRPAGKRVYTVLSGIFVFGAHLEGDKVPFEIPKGKVLVRSELGPMSLFDEGLLVKPILSEAQAIQYDKNIEFVGCLAAMSDITTDIDFGLRTLAKGQEILASPFHPHTR